MAKATTKNNGSSANIGFEAKLQLSADKLHDNMGVAEYKLLSLVLSSSNTSLMRSRIDRI